MEPKVRPARLTDKGPLMSFIKDVWGGHDYIPRVWDDWMHDRHGKMFVVEVDGVPVGMNRIRFLEDGSVWFEGARVHPDYRGRGLATLLGENSMRVARERGSTVFRLTSGSRNKTAHRQIAKIGFDEAARFSVYEPKEETKLNPTEEAESVRQSSAAEVSRAFMRTREFRLGKGVFWHNWAAASITPDLLRKLAREGAVWRMGDAVAIVRGGSEGRDRWEQVCFLGGPGRDAMRLLRSLVGRNRKATERWVYLPQGSPLIHEVRAAGYVRNFAMIMFQRAAAKG